MFLEIRHLRMISELRNSGSLVKTAERLYQTQSAISHQIKAIENHYESPLFIRKSKPLRFTPLGERLLTLADQVLPSIERAEYDLKQYAGSDRGRLHIAIECHSCFDWLIPAMNAYREQWPQIEMDISAGFAFEPVPALAQAQVDLVITSDPQTIDGLQFIPLFEYQALLAISNQHTLTAKRFIEPADLAEETLIIYPVEHKRLDIFTQFLNPAGIQPASIRTAELTLMTLQLVASNRGVAALPSWVLAKYLQQQFVSARPLGPDGTFATLYAGIRSADKNNHFLSAFIDCSKETAAQELNEIKVL